MKVMLSGWQRTAKIALANNNNHYSDHRLMARDKQLEI
jgi:hypothetical protein